MNVLYELWDVETANLVGSYDSEEAALEDVANAVLAHGRSAVETLLLGRENADGGSQPIAEGPALVDRAMAQVDRDSRVAVGQGLPGDPA